VSDLPRDYRTTFSTDAGQRVLANILDKGYATRPFPMGSGQVDPVKLAMAEGARRLALEIKRAYDEGATARRDDNERQTRAVTSLSES